MAKIALMDQHLANMIAAGEVVERPASIIKELIENAIDAGATQIHIEVSEIGLKSITVTDNGSGMEKEDLSLSFLRHATSKIFKKDDLNHIQTLGFRGEALPAIASVAQLEIHSRTNQSDGHFIEVHGSKLINEGPTSINIGTKVIVKALFFNTPARFKYMKSEHAERNAIIESFDKLALSHPHIQFILTLDEKVVKRTLGNGSIPALLDAIYGKGTQEGLKTFETSLSKIGVKGFLVDPKFTRSRRNDVNVFINGRYVRNYRISQSVIDGYHTSLMTNKYPIACLYLTIDPMLVDVNVHPQKMEVKLANEMLFAYALSPIIKTTLEGMRQVIREPLQSSQKEAVYQAQAFDLFEQAKRTEDEGLDDKKELEQVLDKLPLLDYIGTYAGTFLIFQNETGLYLIDQHAAAERIRYEYYVERVGKLSNEHYELLVPIKPHLTQQDFETITTYQKQFNQIGFYFNDDMITAHPVWLRAKELDLALESLVHQLNELGTIHLKRLRDDLAKDIACKGAIKANKQLSRLEIDQLMTDLNGCQNPFTCPHGRPVLIKLSQYDIEKMFKRIV